MPQRHRKPRRASSKLPDRLKGLFWDYDFEALTLESDQDLITRRILASGDWQAVNWLRRAVSSRELATWLQRRQGAGLSPKQLRFWELILELPRQEVDQWLADSRSNSWHERNHDRPR